jgi:hypothetical protein
MHQGLRTTHGCIRACVRHMACDTSHHQAPSQTTHDLRSLSQCMDCTTCREGGIHVAGEPGASPSSPHSPPSPPAYTPSARTTAWCSPAAAARSSLNETLFRKARGFPRYVVVPAPRPSWSRAAWTPPCAAARPPSRRGAPCGAAPCTPSCQILPLPVLIPKATWFGIY